jgi:hypothetical protein
MLAIIEARILILIFCKRQVMFCKEKDMEYL